MNDTIDVLRASRRMPRKAACVFLAERLGRPVSKALIRRWEIDYLAMGRDASYLQADLEAFVEQRLAAAVRRRFRPAPNRPYAKPASEQSAPAQPEPLPPESPAPEPAPEPDLDLRRIYSDRLKLIVGNVGESEGRARAYEYTVSVYRSYHNADLETAKRAVRAALAGKGNRS